MSKDIESKRTTVNVRSLMRQQRTSLFQREQKAGFAIHPFDAEVRR
jgi:hypothetical protein